MRKMVPGTGEKGFTLVELIVTMGLIALAFMIASPSFFGMMERVKLESDARQLAWVLRQARQDAIMKGLPQNIYVYDEMEIYRWNSGGQNRWYHMSPGIDIVSCNCKPLGSGPSAYSFNTNGAPGHAGTTTLKNKNGDVRYVIVSVAIGRVRVSKNPPSSWNVNETY